MQSILEHSEGFLFESVQNLFKNDMSEKKKYGQQVWDILQDAYRSQGGISGSGFMSVDDMIQKIPFWKLDIVDGEVLALVLYKFKDEDGKGYVRKLVAIGTKQDKSRADEIRKKLRNIMKMEFSRSLMEVSGLAEAYFLKYFPADFKKSLIPAEKVVQILPDDEIKIIDEFRYERLIGGSHWHEKVMCGNYKDRTFNIPQ